MPILSRIVLAALLALPAALSAHETRTAPADAEPGAAVLAEADWLLGQWRGEGIGGSPAMESWIAASDDTWVGTFVQQREDGGIHFTEHLYLMQEGETLVLRLKHFNADLTGWEEKDGMLTFRLVEAEPCALYFRGLTLRCDGDDGLLAAVRMTSGKELVFRFTRI